MDGHDARLEVYVRMNDDMEKDYCFSVGLKDSFHDLLKIFKVLKLSLRPSVFYTQTPMGFAVCNDPGFLTPHGGLLFNDDAMDHLQPVAMDDVISDKVWPGQLIVPVWRRDDMALYSVLMFLGTWLYTDLPDIISPTPGICLTNQLSILISKVLIYLDMQKLALDILSETEVNKSGVTAQWIFFGFHSFKVVMIFFVLYFGIFNPYSLNPIKNHQLYANDKLDESKRQELISIGWTGSRRATLDEFREYFRESEIKRVGGIVKASKMQLFEQLKKPGVKLGEGEGFQTPVTGKKAADDEGKFLLSYDYFSELGEFFEHYLSTESTNINQDIKDFRKFGPMGNTERILEIVKKRRAKSLE